MLRILPVLIATSVASLVAQTNWALVRGPEAPREEHALAYDALRSVTVMFGGNPNAPMADTWLWDGVRWSNPAPALQPPPRSDHAMAYDLARGRVVLFGGRAFSAPLADTWEWDGTAWLLRTPAHSPPARFAMAIANDGWRARTVLFGGRTATSVLGDTWEWDGNDWTQLAAVGPAARSGHAMAFDLARARTVLFGGEGDDGSVTWEWDGINWTSVVTSVHPPGAAGASMAHEVATGRTLLLTVLDTASTASSLWSWNGSSWTRSIGTDLHRPTARIGSALAYDLARSRTVVFGGRDAVRLGDTWEWDAARWSTSIPPARSEAAFAFDAVRGTALLFGGQHSERIGAAFTNALCNDTWQWHDGSWHALSPGNVPPSRSGYALACDSARDVGVLFGGGANETWTWSGGNWSQRATSVQPAARTRTAMAYDAARQEVLLFGGIDLRAPLTQFQDTWVWNGTTWALRAPATSPGARFASQIAFDAQRGRCVLFGGNLIFSGVLADTWEWDGSNWALRTPVHSPPGRFGAVLSHDVARGRTVLLGGQGGAAGAVVSEVWEWDGTDWTQRTPSLALPLAAYAAGGYDPVARRTLYIGTAAGGDNWTYGPVQPASLAPFGAACAGSAGTASLRESSGALPWLGDALRFAVEPVPPNAPVLLAIGFSNATFGGVPLPAPLDALGMTGCRLFASIDASLFAIASGARADFPLAVPTTVAVTGLPFFAQAAILDPGANPAGIVASDALAGRIGGR